MKLFHEVVGEGEPLVLLNGIMMTTASWASMTPSLSLHYRCVLHDFRGQARSLVPGPFRLSDHVGDLVELLDDLGIESAHVVGTSYGGEVGMLFTLAHPARVRSLSLIACASHVEPPLRDAITVWRSAAPEDLYEVTAPYNFSPAFLTPEIMAAGRARLAAQPPLFFECFRELCDAFLTLDVTERLHEIPCPALVIAGENDVLKPVQYSKTIASRIPSAELLVIPGAGHAVVIERAGAVGAAVENFLGRIE